VEAAHRSDHTIISRLIDLGFKGLIVVFSGSGQVAMVVAETEWKRRLTTGIALRNKEAIVIRLKMRHDPLAALI
jgi:hypothetical protein